MEHPPQLSSVSLGRPRSHTLLYVPAVDSPERHKKVSSQVKPHTVCTIRTWVVKKGSLVEESSTRPSQGRKNTAYLPVPSGTPMPTDCSATSIASTKTRTTLGSRVTRHKV